MIDVTELGIDNDVRPVQPSKAELPIVVTELGIDNDVRPVQPLKALSAIEVTEYEEPLYSTFSGRIISPVYSFANEE